jgi:hypothetical protein
MYSIQYHSFLKLVKSEDRNFFERHNTNGVNINVQRETMLQPEGDNQTIMLKEIYSGNFVLIYSFIIGTICVALFALQTIMIINQYSLYYFGINMWVSAYFLVLASLALLMSKYFNIYQIR